MNPKRLDGFDAVVIILAAVSFLAMANLPFGAKQFGDADVHIDAKTLAQAVRGEVAWRDVGINRLPFTTLYYAIPYSFLPAGSAESLYWKAALVWNLIWTGVSLLLIRRAGENIAGPNSGNIAVLLVLLSPFIFYYALAISAEAPVWLMAAVMLWGWSRWEQKPTAKSMWVSIAGLSGVVLARPNVVLLLGVALICGLLMWRHQRSRAVFALVSSISVLVINLTVGVVAAQLPHPAGERSAIENLAHVSFHGSFQMRDEPLDWRFWDDKTRQGSADYAHWVDTRQALKQTSAQTGQALPLLQLRWVLQDYLEHPFLRLRMAFIRVAALHIGFTSSMEPDSFHIGPLHGRSGWILFHIVVNASTILVIAASLVFLASRRGALLPLWPLWGPWIAIMGFHALVYVEPRYLMPARPGLLLMAGCGLVYLARHYTHAPLEIAEETVCR